MANEKKQEASYNKYKLGRPLAGITPYCQRDNEDVEILQKCFRSVLLIFDVESESGLILFFLAWESLEIITFPPRGKKIRPDSDSTSKINNTLLKHFVKFRRLRCRVCILTRLGAPRCTYDTRKHARTRTPRKSAPESKIITFILFP